MMLAVVLSTLAAIPVLALVTFVQLLYLESMRLRPRDLPSVKFFKETLEDRLGFETENGAAIYSVIKHTLLVLLGVLFLAWQAGSFWQAAVGAWLTMMAASYAVPQLLYRRTSARWLLPLAPLLRAIAWPRLLPGGKPGCRRKLIDARCRRCVELAGRRLRCAAPGRHDL